MGMPKQSSGFGVGWSGRSSRWKLGSCQVEASVSSATSKKVSAGALIGEVAKLVGGRGGGRPDFAQAGGNDPSKLDEALQAVPRLVAEKLGGT